MKHAFIALSMMLAFNVDAACVRTGSDIVDMANIECRPGFQLQEIQQIPAANSAPAQSRGVAVLAYHRISSALPPGDTVISKERFSEHLDFIVKSGYVTIKIDELVSFMKGKISLPERVVVISLDDGWKDQLTAAKLMRERNMSATFYITSGHFGNTLYMSKEDVIDLAKNRQFEIGAHSHTHFARLEHDDKSKMGISEMVGEMMMSRSLLESLTGRSIRNYAWPYGYATLESVQFAERFGFDSTAMINSSSKNTLGRTMELQRLNISGNCTTVHLSKMLETGILENCNDEKIKGLVE